MNALKVPSKRCAVAASVLAALLLFVGLAVVWPWVIRNSAYNEQMAERAEQLTRFQRLAAQRPGIEAELERVRQADAQTRYYIRASTAAVGAAELQKLVKRIIDSHQGKLISTQALPIQDDGKAVRIVIRVRMSIELDALGEVMHALESGRPLLFVENLSVRGRKVRRRRNQPAAATQELDVRYDLTGYMRRAAG